MTLAGVSGIRTDGLRAYGEILGLLGDNVRLHTLEDELERDKTSETLRRVCDARRGRAIELREASQGRLEHWRQLRALADALESGERDALGPVVAQDRRGDEASPTPSIMVAGGFALVALLACCVDVYFGMNILAKVIDVETLAAWPLAAIIPVLIGLLHRVHERLFGGGHERLFLCSALVLVIVYAISLGLAAADVTASHDAALGVRRVLFVVLPVSVLAGGAVALTLARRHFTAWRTLWRLKRDAEAAFGKANKLHEDATREELEASRFEQETFEACDRRITALRTGFASGMTTLGETDGREIVARRAAAEGMRLAWEADHGTSAGGPQ